MRRGSIVYPVTRGLAELVFFLMYQVEIEREEASLARFRFRAAHAAQAPVLRAIAPLRRYCGRWRAQSS